MVSAINASIVADGKLTISNTDSPNVMLWAKVKAVIVFIKFCQPKTINNKPKTNYPARQLNVPRQA